jgi:hypothetical protein
MAAPIQGVGSLIVNDLLTDISLKLFQTFVKTTVPGGGIAAGLQTVNVWDNSMYQGAYVLVGVLGGDLEVVLISAVNPGASFTAVFQNVHGGGEPIVGATFPVQNTAGDPLFEQSEMVGYLSEAMNDFLLRVPLAYAVTDSISMPPTTQFTGLPADCMMPVRVAATFTAAGLYPLRETSQANLDGYDYRWQRQTGSAPQAYYRDKIGLNQFGIWPVQNNTVPTEIVYAQRSSQFLHLGDGFLIPDPFLPTIKARVLSTAYGKDGEQRSPGMSKWWGDRYETGVKIAGAILEIINDPNMQ